jgi:acyl carrier protein
VQPAAEDGAFTDLARWPAEERFRRCTTMVQSMTGTILGLDTAPADIDQGFFDMGFNSLMSLELKNRLEAAIRIPLPTTLVFDYPTIRNLAEFIAGGTKDGRGDVTTRRIADRPAVAIGDGEADLETDVDIALTQRLEKLEALMGQR